MQALSMCALGSGVAVISLNYSWLKVGQLCEV